MNSRSTLLRVLPAAGVVLAVAAILWLSSRGGDATASFDMLAAMEQWVEQGKAPDRIEASRVRGPEQKTDRTRPLCAYPQVARYTGTGSIDDASNFRCVAP